MIGGVLPGDARPLTGIPMLRLSYFFAGAGGRNGGPEVGLVASHLPVSSNPGSLASRFWRRAGIMSMTSKPQVCKMRSMLAQQEVVPLPLPPA